MNKPNLSLAVEIESTNGARYRLDPSHPDPGNRPIGLNWRTKLGEGFSDGGASLARRVDLDHPDLGLNDIWTIIDANTGDVYFEGRVAGQPRTLDERHSLGVTLVGRMADAKRRKFREIYVDRDVARWGDMSLDRKALLGGAGISTGDFSYASSSDGMVLSLPNQALGTQTDAETWYFGPPGVKIAQIVYQATTTTLPAGYGVFFAASDNSAGTSESYTPTNDNTLRTVALTTPRSNVMHQTYSNGVAATPAAGANLRIVKIATYGNHGLATYPPTTAGEPNGVRVTDVLRDIINRFCPGLNVDGASSSDYVIAHLAFAERTYPYDAFLQLNKYLLWKLAVWERGRVVFEPHDLTDYTWQIRTDDPNVKLEWQGPSTETIYNGVAITYTDLITGREAELTPDDRPDLRDVDPENPFNKAGIDQWLEVTLSTPQLADDAALIGRAELAEANRPKAPGSFTVTGHIRNRAGDWQPVARVRAGDTIAVTNHPNDAPRLIVETDYQDDGKQLRVATDMPFNLMEAINDRIEVELQAIGARR